MYLRLLFGHLLAAASDPHTDTAVGDFDELQLQEEALLAMESSTRFSSTRFSSCCQSNDTMFAPVRNGTYPVVQLCGSSPTDSQTRLNRGLNSLWGAIGLGLNCGIEGSVDTPIAVSEDVASPRSLHGHGAYCSNECAVAQWATAGTTFDKQGLEMRMLLTRLNWLNTEARPSAEFDQFIVLATDATHRVSGETVYNATSGGFEASLVFPKSGEYLVEVYWMQSGESAASEPNGTLGDVMSANDRSRCTPQAAVDSFMFVVPSSTSSIIDLESVNDCRDNDPRARPLRGVWEANWSAVANGAAGAHATPWMSNKWLILSLISALDEESYKEQENKNECSHKQDVHFHAGTWIPHYLETGVCRYREYTPNEALSVLNALDIARVVLFGDSHGSALALGFGYVLGGSFVVPFRWKSDPMLLGLRQNVTFHEQHHIQSTDTCEGVLTWLGGHTQTTPGKNLVIVTLGLWWAAYSDTGSWKAMISSVKDGLTDCRSNYPELWAANIIVWAEIKYRFSGNGWYTTNYRIKHLNDVAYALLGGIVDGWLDAFSMSKSAPEYTPDCNHWKPSADARLANAALNKLEAAARAGSKWQVAADNN
jgi:hypothetical protein